MNKKAESTRKALQHTCSVQECTQSRCCVCHGCSNTFLVLQHFLIRCAQFCSAPV